jgi:hypothetical protein
LVGLQEHHILGLQVAMNHVNFLVPATHYSEKSVP